MAKAKTDVPAAPVGPVVPPVAVPAPVAPPALPAGPIPAPVAAPKPLRVRVTIPTTHVGAIEVEIAGDVPEPERRAAAVRAAAEKIGVTETAPGRFGFGVDPVVEFLD